jgi:hypothetical protein
VCPDCLGKGRQNAEDRKAVWILRGIGAAITLVIILLAIVQHWH